MVVEKRRRKKARIQAESSSEDESSGAESIHETAEELSEISDQDDEEGDVTMDSVPAPVANETAPPRELLHKAPLNSQVDFNQVFLKLVTEQFGDDLAALRQSNDFGPASISQLVAGLKQGVDIFSPEQQRMLAEADRH